MEAERTRAGNARIPRGAEGLRSRRWVGWGTGSAVAVVGLMMVLSPFAAAKGYVAPFHGQTEKYNVQATNGCYKLHVGVKGHISIKTGIAGFAAATKATNCKGALGQTFYSESEVVASDNLLIPIKVGPGNHSVQVTGTGKFSTSGSIVPGTGASCPTTTYVFGNTTEVFGFCEVVAETEVIGIAELFDATNSSWCPGTWCTGGGPVGIEPIFNFSFAENYTDVFYICTTGSGCTSYNSSYTTPTTSWSIVGATQTGTAYLNGTFVAGHHYYVVWQTEGFVFSETYLAPGGSAMASVDYGSAGNGIALKSILVV